MLKYINNTKKSSNQFMFFIFDSNKFDTCWFMYNAEVPFLFQSLQKTLFSFLILVSKLHISCALGEYKYFTPL